MNAVGQQGGGKGAAWWSGLLQLKGGGEGRRSGQAWVREGRQGLRTMMASEKECLELTGRRRGGE